MDVLEVAYENLNIQATADTESCRGASEQKKLKQFQDSGQRAAENFNISFRTQVRSDDQEIVRNLCESTDFFRPDEVDVAVELVQENLSRGIASGYYFIFAE
ncbi:MAG: hypothetical protein HQK55_16765, partial [Deltaproteobacteria bacterium]|nr:hypothetical protein [Deltaproteobacteria bacterium]